MKYFVSMLVVSSLVMVMATACSSVLPTNPTSSHSALVRDHVSFVDHLRTRNIQVGIGDLARQPFLRGYGTTLLLSGGPLQQPATVESFNYDDTDLQADGGQIARADLAALDASGQPRTGAINWAQPPHFFHQERVIVLYLGNDPAVLALLTTALGPQVAGQ